MKIEFQDRTWDLDELGITNKQAEKIRDHTGLSVQRWLASLNDRDAFAWESSFDALYWLMLQQDGKTDVAIRDVDYPVYRFMEAYIEAMKAAQPAEEAEPDPTRPPAASAPSRAPRSPKPTSHSGEAAPDG